jgi:glucosamine-6-phosphate deaminase
VEFMDVVIRPDRDEAAELTARIIARRLREKPHLVLGLATGRTMERVYSRLIRIHREDGLDFSRCRTFNLDEYIGLPPEDAQSYRGYMDRHLFDHVNIEKGNTYLPDGMAPDLKAESERYEQLIRESGGIGLQLVGIGTDGHIGFNEPLSAFRSRTRDKALMPSTRRQNAECFGGDVQRVPRRALTMGVGTILEAREIVLLATGASKAEIVARAIEGPLCAMVTASAVQFHPKCRVILDDEAAAGLQAAEYCRWVYENDDDWAPFRDGTRGTRSP